MPILLLLSSIFFASTARADPRASGEDWNLEVRRSIPDILAVEIAMQRAGLRPRDASLVYGRTTWTADSTGLVHRRGSLGWRELVGPAVLEELTGRQGRSRRVCAMVAGHDPVPGGRQLQLYQQKPVAEDDLDLERAEPRFILGTGKEHEVLITALRPGDQIQITEAIPVGGGPKREHLELKRKDRSLSVTRLGNGSRVCLAANR